jgi:hypothetical protein
MSKSTIIPQSVIAALPTGELADGLHQIGHIVRDHLGKQNSGNIILEAAYRLAETRKLSERATAVILHSLDIFIADDCKVVDGCTHFEGLEIPTREEMEELINVIAERGLATLPVPEPESQESDAADISGEGRTPEAPAAPAGIADLLSKLGGSTVPDAEPGQSDEAELVGSLKRSIIRLLFSVRSGNELTRESLDAEMVRFRNELTQVMTATAGDGSEGGKFLEAANALGVPVPSTFAEIEDVIAKTRKELEEAL